MTPESWLQAQVRSHNHHACWLALLSLAAAVLAWNLAYFFFVLILLGLVTAVRGDFGPQTPIWIPSGAFALVVILLGWGVVDHFRHRFAGAPDRPIIGWHLFADFLLLPIRLTFAIWGNLSAVRNLNGSEIERACGILSTIQREGRSHITALRLIEPDPARLFRIVNTLQMLDLIDLHRGENSWYYTVRSTHWAELGKLLASGD